MIKDIIFGMFMVLIISLIFGGVAAYKEHLDLGFWDTPVLVMFFVVSSLAFVSIFEFLIIVCFMISWISGGL